MLIQGLPPVREIHPESSVLFRNGKHPPNTRLWTVVLGVIIHQSRRLRRPRRSEPMAPSGSRALDDNDNIARNSARSVGGRKHEFRSRHPETMPRQVRPLPGMKQAFFAAVDVQNPGLVLALGLSRVWKKTVRAIRGPGL